MVPTDRRSSVSAKGWAKNSTKSTLTTPYVRGTPPMRPAAVPQPEYVPPPAEAAAEDEGETIVPASTPYPSAKVKAPPVHPPVQPLTMQYMRGLTDFLNNH